MCFPRTRFGYFVDSILSVVFKDTSSHHLSSSAPKAVSETTKRSSTSSRAILGKKKFHLDSFDWFGVSHSSLNLPHVCFPTKVNTVANSVLSETRRFLLVPTSAIFVVASHSRKHTSHTNRTLFSHKMAIAFNMTRLYSVLALAVLLTVLIECGAYTVGPKGGGKRPSSKRWFQEPKGRTSYFPKTSPTSSAPKSPSSRQDKDQQRRQGSTTLSQSVLCSSDTLPSFPTAHGLLSPETVMMMEKRTAHTGRNKELTHFLTTYRRHGPLSCLPMLSDPRVLPHLTEALRDIV